MAKKIASSLKDIFNNPIAKKLMNRSKPIDWQYFIDLWKPDLFSRKPAPAYTENGETQGTDLDLHTFLYALIERKAVINIPVYQSMRETVKKEGQIIVSHENRHGKCVGLSSSQDMFSFGVRIIDANVITSSDVGDFRVYNVLNVLGEWHEGWKYIQFIPDKRENDFITNWKLDIDNKISFKHFVSPQRRYTIYSAPYFLTKLAIARLNDETNYLSGIIKYMNSQGITLPEEKKKEWPKALPQGNVQKIKIKSVTFDVDIPPLTGMYPEIEMTQENLIKTIEKRKWLVYTIKPQIQYALRGNEYANFKYAPEDKEFPHWIQGSQWEKDYKMPPTFTINADFLKKHPTNFILHMMKERAYKENELSQFLKEYEELQKQFKSSFPVPETKVTRGRIAYKRLVMFQPDVGMYGVSLLKKEFEKTEELNKDFEFSDNSNITVKKI